MHEHPHPTVKQERGATFIYGQDVYYFDNRTRRWVSEEEWKYVKDGKERTPLLTPSKVETCRANIYQVDCFASMVESARNGSEEGLNLVREITGWNFGDWALWLYFGPLFQVWHLVLSAFFLLGSKVPPIENAGYLETKRSGNVLAEIWYSFLNVDTRYFWYNPFASGTFWVSDENLPDSTNWNRYLTELSYPYWDNEKLAERMWAEFGYWFLLDLIWLILAFFVYAFTVLPFVAIISNRVCVAENNYDGYCSYWTTSGDKVL